MFRPTVVNILGVPYRITYHINALDVDIDGDKALFGQICFRSRTIRILDNGRPAEDVFRTLLHEIIHGITDGLGVPLKEADLDRIATGMADVLVRNEWIDLHGNTPEKAQNSGE